MVKKLLLILVMLLCPLSVMGQTTVGGSLVDTGLTSISSTSTFARFTLQNYTAQPRVIGTGIMVDLSIDCTQAMITAGTCKVAANSVITPANSYWRVCFFNSGVLVRCLDYTVAGTFNLNTATPLLVAPIATAPTGDTTYIRSDGANATSTTTSVTFPFGSISAPQTGNTAPVQIGSVWYPGTASGIVPAPETFPTAAVDATSGGSIGNGTYYFRAAYVNRNGETTVSPTKTLVVSTCGGNACTLVFTVNGGYSWKNGAIAYRIYASTDNVNFYLQETASYSKNISTIARASNVVTLTTTAAHSLFTGKKVIIAGVTDASFNGTFTVTSVVSDTVVTYAQTAANANDTTGTATWKSGLDSLTGAARIDRFYIATTLSFSGTVPPVSNTSAIDPVQVGLNAIQDYSVAFSPVAGMLMLPSAYTTLTTPLVVTTSQKLVSSAKQNQDTANFNPTLNCPFADAEYGCVTVVQAKSLSWSGININSAGHGLFIAGSSRDHNYSDGSIRTTSSSGLYAAVRFQSHTGQTFSIDFKNIYLRGDKAAVLSSNMFAANIAFRGSRWDMVKSGFVNEPGPTDPDRNTNSLISGMDITLEDLFTESGTGVLFDMTDTQFRLSRVAQADSNSTADAMMHVGDSSWGTGGNGFFSSIKDCDLRSAVGTSTGIKAFGSVARIRGLHISNSYFGDKTNSIDLNSLNLPLVIEGGTDINPNPAAVTRTIANIPATSYITVIGAADGLTAGAVGLQANNLFWGGTMFRPYNSNVYRRHWNWDSTDQWSLWTGDPATAANRIFSSGTAKNNTFWNTAGTAALLHINAASTFGGTGSIGIGRAADNNHLVVIPNNTDFSAVNNAGSSFLVLWQSTTADKFSICGTNCVSTLTAKPIESTLATGTAPFTIASTTKSTNLNADLLDDLNTATAATASTVAARDASGRLTVARILAVGTALVAGDFAPNASWGAGAAVSAVAGSDQGFEFTVTAAGVPLNNPITVLTFKDLTWTNNPIFVCGMGDTGTGAIGQVLTSTSATVLNITWVGLPVAASTYQFKCVGMGR